MNTTTATPPAVAPVPPAGAARNLLLRALKIASRIALPVVSILGLWYLAIAFSGLPEFVIPRPTQVLAVLTQWDEFRWLDFDRVLAALARPRVLDARNLLDPVALRRRGFTYDGVGR